MNSDPNPYQPPAHWTGARVVRAISAEGEAELSFAFTLDQADMSAGLAATVRSRWFTSLAFGIGGFGIMSPFGVPGRIITAALLAALGWFLSLNRVRASARLALANRSEEERRTTWRFFAEGVEGSTAGSYFQIRWSAFHRFVENPQTFVLYSSELAIHIIPKRVLDPDLVALLRDLFRSRITPRRRPRGAVVWVLALWAILVLMFLAVWQLLRP